jgi:hypothetical protein
LNGFCPGNSAQRRGNAIERYVYYGDHNALVFEHSADGAVSKVAQKHRADYVTLGRPSPLNTNSYCFMPATLEFGYGN